MVNAGSRCAARLNVGGVVVTAGVVVLGFVAAPPPRHAIGVEVSAVRLAAVTAPQSARWAALDQLLTAAAQLGTGAATLPHSGPSAGSEPAKPMPLAATSTPAGPTPLAATPTPLAGIPVISNIGSAIASAFWSLVGPLVNNAVVGPFVLFGAIFFGIFVVAPITYVVQTVQQFFAPLFGLLPVAASPVAAKTVAPTAAVAGPGAATQDVAPAGGADAGANTLQAPLKVPSGFLPKRQKPTAVVPTAVVPTAVVPTAATADVNEADNGNAQGRVAPNQLNAPGVRGNGGGPSPSAGKSDAGQSDSGKSLSRNKKSSSGSKPGKGTAAGS